MTGPSPDTKVDPELRANALRAANGRSHARGRFRWSWAWEWAKVFPAAIVLFLVLRTFLVEAYKIPTGSMEQTLMVGDFLLVNKLVYGAQVPFSTMRTPAIRQPVHGDVVVFAFPLDPGKSFVKRLVGVAGDTLSMRNGVLVRNGAPQVEDYVIHLEPGVDPVTDEFRWQRGYLVRAAVAADAPAVLADTIGTSPVTTFSTNSGYRPSRNNWGPLVIPAGHSFMLGDNRDNSLDSRYWGFVPDSLVRGTPMVIYYSFVPDSAASAPWLTRIRWERFGTRVR